MHSRYNNKTEEARQFAVACGKAGGEKLKEAMGESYYHDIGVAGGAALKDKYGPEHFSGLGKIGGKIVCEKRWGSSAEQAERAEKIVALYQAGKSAPEIVELVGCSVTTIYKKLRHAGVPVRRKRVDS